MVGPKTQAVKQERYAARGTITFCIPVVAEGAREADQLANDILNSLEYQGEGEIAKTAHEWEVLVDRIEPPAREPGP
ncbi:MAG: hypothetical protein AMJ38_02255 [Dehalococcoidia bacterium DG_22]|nr:MAG: hypothetical protein AMJ38_02255 [Dehalococcoidia bacterium DG_22]